ncbi:MAG: TIGR04053 family radical SAM/SPASM domain-containing protein [Chloroflexi bacterium]|nr:TIGR04053 family radical SAM/SPASM domain-containing protein [Chloroflexota bacterium]
MVDEIETKETGEGKVQPRLVAWETTRACNLACVHCRAEAQYHADPNQLTTQEGFKLLDEIASFARPIIILTGGEPLLRPDIYEIAAYGSRLGLRMVMSPCGTSLTPEVVKKLKECGIMRLSISLDGSSPEVHDNFRQTPGAFEATIRGMRYCVEAGLSFQVNTTVTKRNVDDLPKILETVLAVGAAAWHPFMLVPTGRGKAIRDEEVSPGQYEATLLWVETVSRTQPILVKPTCAPHYVRILRQAAVKQRREGGASAPEQGRSPAGHPHDARHGGNAPHMTGYGLHTISRGCMAGDGFCFVSHLGEVHGCGFLPILAGNVREKPFPEIYQNSPVFRLLRDYGKLEGKCGACEYRAKCGGCRARAYAETGNYLDEEPYCVYEPLAREVAR